MLKLVSDIRRLGGIASKAELLMLGHDADMIRLFADSGRHVLRIRKGWYCTPDIEPQVLQAFRVGGRLACVSAAAFHGLVAWPESDEIHIAFHRHDSRLRTRTNPRARLSGNPDPNLVPHWSRRALTGTRKAVSVQEAVEQMNACQPIPASRAARRALAKR